MTRLRAARALIGGAVVGPVVLELAGARIRTVRPARDDDVVDVDLVDGMLSAGLLDLQVNGAFGVDVAAADGAAWRTLLAGLAAHGITGVQPTVITAPLPEAVASLARIGRARDAFADEPVARVLGAHAEGPFLSPARAGAHRAEWLLAPESDHIDALVSDPGARRALRTVTLAPELPGALEAVRRLTREGVVVAVGHSDATAAQVHAAGDAGATMTTHVFNAQRPLTAREPGVPGAVLVDDRFFVGTIIDGRHLDPRVVSLVMTAAGRRTVGVSDAIVTAGLAPGEWHDFGGQPVANDDTGLGRRPDGTIAGAGVVLDEDVRRMIAAGLDPAAVLAACTENAARSLGRTDIGHVAEGALADLVWWDSTWHPSRVWVGGRALASGSR
ncbi:amidohydrolase family protein [Microbacterium sp.]|uniref:N-acetylglucosamine-6-phosphate deacetylase n=1 Tax=Microbacterium sp. TaxID=51671 RepID=UPI0025FA93B9|nr:amidohydrolase family protein [Microbacterium sp.]MBT9607248.1 amidohydrolase family protein [Microbacterium sp.]